MRRFFFLHRSKDCSYNVIPSMRLDTGEMGDHTQKYVSDSNDMNLKNSFWKKNIRNLPGRYIHKTDLKNIYFLCVPKICIYRASPKKENKSVSSFASTSFDDFQESVSDAWEIDAEDEILRISGKQFNDLIIF